ncbi:MAG: YafY family transcriptional regulator [Opitutaceae bacterium]|nr:YafY family transcriptional regulator [Verrucomicrobiales bacterium]
MATILLLQSRRVITAGDIASHFEISLRTVYRDIAALSEGGVPIVAEAGVGYRLLNSYSIPPVMFTPEEASALFLGGELVEHLTDPSLQAQMRSALLKIRSVLPRSHQDRLDRLQRTTALLIARPSTPNAKRSALTQIQSALAQRRVLEICYQTKGEGNANRREVEPLGLVFYSDYWHLIAYCRIRCDFRDFRTDRIIDLTVRDEVFQGHPDFSLRDHIDAWRDGFKNMEIVLKVERPVVDRFRRAWVGGIIEERWQADWLKLTVLADECDWMVSWLLSFGCAVQVISPVSLRLRMAKQAFEVARHHGAVEIDSGKRNDREDAREHTDLVGSVV